MSANRIRPGRLAACLTALFLAGTGQTASHDHPEPVVLAPGYADLTFVPPAAGSYTLPPVGTAADATVLVSDGREGRLHDLLGDSIVLLSFIYTTCNDINGCPLATHVLRGVQNRVLEDPELAKRVRLISYSFDPARDTPEVLSEYAGHFRKPGFDWQFLTAPSEAELARTLQAYDQWVIRDYDAEGNYLGSMSHLLRVYLIDRQMRLRNVYSVSFLHADTLTNDIRTLLMEAEAS